MYSKTISTVYKFAKITFSFLVVKVPYIISLIHKGTPYKNENHLKILNKHIVYKELSYRLPKTVTEAIFFKSHDGFDAYPICPTCKVSFEREFQSYCDRCGQKLDWTGFSYDTCVRHIAPNQPFHTF